MSGAEVSDYLWRQLARAFQFGGQWLDKLLHKRSMRPRDELASQDRAGYLRLSSEKRNAVRPVMSALVNDGHQTFSM